MKYRSVIVFGVLYLIYSTFLFGNNNRLWDLEVKKVGNKVLVLTACGVNIVAVSTEKGIVVFDSHISPVFAKEIRQAIEREFKRSDFLYLINTHHHLENTGGNKVFSDCQIIGTSECSQHIMKNYNLLTAYSAQCKEKIDQINREIIFLGNSDDERIKNLNIEKKLLEQVCSSYQGNYKISTPTKLIQGKTSLYLGDITINLYSLKNCHSASDLIAVIPEEQLAIVGDLNEKIWLASDNEQKKPYWLNKLTGILKSEGVIKNIIGSHESNLEKIASSNFKYFCLPCNEYESNNSIMYAMCKTIDLKGIEQAIAEYESTKKRNDYYFQTGQYIEIISRLMRFSKDKEALEITKTLANDFLFDLTATNDLEKIFNIRSYELLKNGKVDIALMYMKMNTKLYSDSWNAFDSYAEGLLAKGDTNQAIQNYLASIKLNPNNKNAIKLLKKIDPQWIDGLNGIAHRLSDELYKISFGPKMFANTVIFSQKDYCIAVDPGYECTKNTVCNIMKDINAAGLKYVINTHLHPDHAGCNESFPRNIICINYKTLDDLASEGAIFKVKPEFIGIFNKEFQNYYTLNTNNEEIIFVPYPGLHSETDMIVYFRKNNILCMGDLLISNSYPQIGSNVKGYIKFMDKILRTFPPDTKFISGHGIDLTYNDLQKYTDILKKTVNLVVEEIKSGKSLEEIRSKNCLKNFEEPDGSLTFSHNENWVRDIYSSYRN